MSLEIKAKNRRDLCGEWGCNDVTSCEICVNQMWVPLEDAQKSLRKVSKANQILLKSCDENSSKIVEANKILTNWCKECEHDTFSSQCENDCKIIDLKKVLK